MDMLVGNHDIYYKNTLRVNAPGELLEGYGNISVYTEPTTIDIDGLPVLLLPWICDENYERTLGVIDESDAPVCMGHLEITTGFSSPWSCDDERDGFSIIQKNLKRFLVVIIT